MSDASAKALQGLTLYGKTTQDGTPTPDAPVALNSAGDSGSIGVSITDGTEDNVQTLTISTPNGLPGIPVSSGGNYTDSNGQQWLCDEIDLARGVYVQRIGKVIYDGTESFYRAGSTGFYTPLAQEAIAFTHKTPCTHFIGSVDGGYNGRNGQVCVAKTRVYICSTKFSTTVELTEWLAQQYAIGTPATLCYPLATPVETLLDAETLAAYAALHSNKPNTTVTNDAGAGQKISYVADTKLYIDHKFTEVTNAIVAMGGTI